MWQTLIDLNLREMFGLDVALLEIIIRGTLIYLGLFALIRFVLRREAGAVGIADLLLIVLIADAAQNAMAAEYHSVTSGFVLVATLAFWDYLIDWLGYQSPWFRRLAHPPALLLVQKGQLLKRNMRKELITEDELLGELRKQGVDELGKVKEARMEEDGRISVIQLDDTKQHATNKQRAT
jgi:uncharacterized membrane protein YcaP (DUF421 family)